jgi:hypothetical protein
LVSAGVFLVGLNSGTSSLVGADAVAQANSESVPGEARIRGRGTAEKLTIRTTSRLAGAIDSLKWRGREFIDSTDHGRQLQSACSFDLGRDGEFWAECYNPTEAGSRRDGAGPRSSSRLLRLEQGPDWLETRTRMAFWLRPGETSAGRPALNTTELSTIELTKRVQVGWRNLPQVVDYRVTFHVPETERHSLAQFEALTGYLPAEFDTFWCFDPRRGDLAPLDDGPGEQPLPVVLATRDRSAAMGIWSGAGAQEAPLVPGYGRWRFAREQVVKWNCVYRVRNAQMMVSGDHSFQLYVPVGTLDEVRDMLRELSRTEGRKVN